jgi:hypothetical protein
VRKTEQFAVAQVIAAHLDGAAVVIEVLMDRPSIHRRLDTGLRCGGSRRATVLRFIAELTRGLPSVAKAKSGTRIGPELAEPDDEASLSSGIHAPVAPTPQTT